MAETPWMYDFRLWAADIGNAQKVLGFRDYGVRRADIETERYVSIFRDVNTYFSGALKLAIASDIADVPAEKFLPKGVNTWIDYGFLYGFTIKDREYCKQNRAFNKFDKESAGIRFAQITGGGLLENIDLIKPVREKLPGPLKLMLPSVPAKTAFVMGMIFERADERYYNQFGRWKPEGVTPPKKHDVYRPKAWSGAAERPQRPARYAPLTVEDAFRDTLFMSPEQYGSIINSMRKTRVKRGSSFAVLDNEDLTA